MMRTALRGFLMGSADIVPGVSGGTVALVLYLSAVDRGDPRRIGRPRPTRSGARRERWRRTSEAGRVVVPPAATRRYRLWRSWLCRTSSKLLLVDHPETTAGLFSGLVAGSVVVAWHPLQRPRHHTNRRARRCGLVTFVLLGLKESTSTAGIEERPIRCSPTSLAGRGGHLRHDPARVSGSFLLVMLGMYGGVLGAVNERDLLPLAVFGVGAVLGPAVFSQAPCTGRWPTTTTRSCTSRSPDGRVGASCGRGHRVDRFHRAHAPGDPVGAGVARDARFLGGGRVRPHGATPRAPLDRRRGSRSPGLTVRPLTRPRCPWPTARHPASARGARRRARVSASSVSRAS
ncbi:MAG: DUF368 domain-containing protein [Ilumatobacteraceae bacterium]